MMMNFVITLGIENLLNLLDDDKGVIRYGYYSGRIPVIDLKMLLMVKDMITVEMLSDIALAIHII